MNSVRNCDNGSTFDVKDINCGRNQGADHDEFILFIFKFVYSHCAIRHPKQLFVS
jgi:hypothetical protein